MPWWQKWPLELQALLYGLAPEYHHFQPSAVGNALLFTGEVEVDDVGRRRVTVVFRGRPSRTRPLVFADGPERSRHRFHRFAMSDLCLYYERDPDHLRWTLRHRLTGLLDLTRVHLLKEAWWRVTGRWPSPEVHRDPDEFRAASKTKSRNASGSSRGRSRRLRRERRTCWCGTGRYTKCHGALTRDDELRALSLL